MIIKIAEDKFILRFESGNELISELTKFCADMGISGAWISGLGSSDSVTLSFYDLKTQAYRDHILNERLEIASLTGNVAVLNGELFVHLHGVFGDSTLTARAGHVKKLVVSATCEILLKIISGGLKREHDDTTGLNLLE